MSLKWPLSSPAREYALSLGGVIAATAVCFLIYPHFEQTNLVMVYLVGVLVIAGRGHRGPAALSSTLSILVFDFFFVPPRFTLTVSDSQYIWTFVVMFATAMLTSHLTIRVREEAQAARQGEERSVWLLEKAKKAEIEAEGERMRSSLLSSVSHDLRTPLAAIMGSASTLLEKKTIQGEARELLETIEGEAERLSRLVRNLLETTRLESGKIKLNKSAYPLEEVVGSALEHMQKTLKDRDVVVTIPDNLPAVQMDPVLLEQVFVNLLENGVRHAPPKSPLEITAVRKGFSIEVTVADRGPGLKAGEAEHVFEKFYHGEGSAGAGLGLAICRAIVNAHEGQIWAENRVGGGAAFSFRLPLA